MATFTCPTDNIVAGILPETRGTKRRLYSYRWATARGRNVFYLTNGSITEVAPDGTTVTWAQVETVWWEGTQPLLLLQPKPPPWWQLAILSYNAYLPLPMPVLRNY